MVAHNEYPKALVDMLMKRGKKRIPEILPEIHKKFPDYKKRLTRERAYALDNWHKMSAKKRKNKGRKKSVVQFADAKVGVKKTILMDGLVFKEQGKTPNAVRDCLSEKFEAIVLPPSRQLSKMITQFAGSGEVPHSRNGRPSKNKMPYSVSIKGPGIDIDRGTTDDIGEKILHLLFKGE